jgi:hypothetical protein
MMVLGGELRHGSKGCLQEDTLLCKAFEAGGVERHGLIGYTVRWGMRDRHMW